MYILSVKYSKEVKETSQKTFRVAFSYSNWEIKNKG
jgi:hypothetical protein